MLKLKVIALLVLTTVYSGLVVADTPAQQPTREKTALLIEQKGLSTEETAVLTKTFSDDLQATGKFDVMSHEEMTKLFVQAQFPNIETCNYSYCLADAGKILGVSRVMHGSMQRRGKLFTLRLQLIDVHDATIVYERRSEYSGEFEGLITETLPREAQAAGKYSLEPETKWYVITAAIAVTVGAIYLIYQTLNKLGTSEGTGAGAPSTTQ